MKSFVTTGSRLLCCPESRNLWPMLGELLNFCSIVYYLPNPQRSTASLLPVYPQGIHQQIRRSFGYDFQR